MANVQTEPATGENHPIVIAEAPNSQVRVDGAHSTSHAGAPEESLPQDRPETPDEHSTDVEQLRIQAGQLAGHLQRNRRQLDQREAELNARTFQLEAELRTSKLWIREKRHELSQREAELERRGTELEQRAASIAAAELACEENLFGNQHRRQQKETELQQRENELERRQRQLADESTELHRRRSEQEQREAAARQKLLAEQQAARELHRNLLAQLETRRAVVEKSAADRQSSVAPSSDSGSHRDQPAGSATISPQTASRGRPTDRRLNGAARRDGQEAHRRQASILNKRRRELDQRRDSLNQRAEANERLHAEITQKHREALELRLATEQLWAQLSSRAGPQISHSLAALRSELADAFRRERERLADQKNQAQALADRLESQQSRLGRQRKEVERWAFRRRTEIEEQAVRLVARERELDERELRITSAAQAR